MGAPPGRRLGDVGERSLPHDYPHWNTVDACFARWPEEGVFDQLNSLLHHQVRRQASRETEPSACVIDSQ
ncbi:hypothetical protein [Streptomyces sp. NPDC059378]|uniref:hypothetical protein n=1 Tax=Streptomyces sp. NPDC059378 TaxID=3346815 RepID=UPI0036B7EA84